MQQSQLNSETLDFSSPNEKINQAMRLVNEARAETMATAKGRIASEYEDKINKLNQMTSQAKDQVNQSMEIAEGRIKDRPFAFIAGASLIGLIIGMLMGRRR